MWKVQIQNRSESIFLLGSWDKQPPISIFWKAFDEMSFGINYLYSQLKNFPFIAYLIVCTFFYFCGSDANYPSGPIIRTIHH